MSRECLLVDSLRLDGIPFPIGETGEAHQRQQLIWLGGQCPLVLPLSAVKLPLGLEERTGGQEDIGPDLVWLLSERDSIGRLVDGWLGR